MELLALVLALPLSVGLVALGWWLGCRQTNVPEAVSLRQADWLETVTRRRVLVHTRDGQTLDGQLARVDRDGLVLAPASLADGPHDLDGDVFVPRDRVAWMQQPH